MKTHGVSAFFLLILFLSGAAQAQRPPETHPASENRRIVLTYDRSSLPPDHVLWADRTVLGFSTNAALLYGRIHLTCVSSSSPERGQCPTSHHPDASLGQSAIPLRFVERRSGLATNVTLTGFHQRIGPTKSCAGDYWMLERRPLWSSTGGECLVTELPIGTGAALSLSSSELQKLVAGRWDAVLELALRADPDGPILATYLFTFDLTITDHANASIYFPLFDHVTPHVGLNIDYIPTGSPPTIGGSAGLDMCLYDGLGSQSQYLDVTISDDGRPAPGRRPGMYSVWRKGGTSDEVDRLDYQITMDYDDAKIAIHNARVERLSGVDTSKLRLVVLPSMVQPVYCVPTPLALITPRVAASSKAEGYYEGRLRIEMNMPVSSP